MELANIAYLLSDASLGSDDQDSDPLLALFGPGKPASYAAELIGAFFAELVYLNRYEGFGECAVATTDSIQAVQKVLSDIEAGNGSKAMAHGIAAAHTLKSTLEQCKTDAGGEALEVASWMGRTMSS